MTDRIEAIRARHAAIERVLAEHWAAGMASNGAPHQWECVCGQPIDMSDEAHQSHVAREIEYALRVDAERTALAPVASDAEPDEPEHAPVRVLSNMGIPFIDCSCGADHYVQSATWLETHWKGTQAEGLAAIQGVIDRQHEANGVSS